MKVILIDDFLSITNFDSVRCSLPEATAAQIHEEHRDADLFMINVNYRVDGMKRVQNAGVMLLKYLRLSHFRQHCILYSFFSRDQLVRHDPYNIILFSKGVTFIQLPHDLRSIDYSGLCKIIAPEDLSTYFLAESKLPDDRHFFANWWGALKIWNIQWKVIEGLEYRDSRPIYNVIFRNAKAEIDSYQGKLAMYLYTESGSKSGYRLPRYHNEIKSIIEKLREARPRVLFIDDHARLGWSGVLQRMIYGENSEDCFKVIDPHGKGVHEIYLETKELIKSFDPNLIILDLRLKGETGTIDDFKHISGVQLLGKLPRVYRNCPILLFSATNKIEVFKGTFRKGISAFWIKEGPDERRSDFGSYLNYVQLLNLLYVLTQSEEFAFYCYFKKMLNEIRVRKKSFWWVTSDWVDETERENKSEPLRKEDALFILQNASDIIENYLRVAILTQKRVFSLRVDEQFPSMIVIMLSSIIERIHKVDYNPERVSLGVLMEKQFNKRYKAWEELILIRNRAAHQYNLSFDELKRFSGSFFKYLNDYRK